MSDPSIYFMLSRTWCLCVEKHRTPDEFWEVWDKRLPLPIGWSRSHSPSDIERYTELAEERRPYDTDFLEFLYDGECKWFAVFLRDDSVIVMNLEDIHAPIVDYASSLASLLDHIHTAFSRFTIMPAEIKTCIEDHGPWIWKGEWPSILNPSIRVQGKHQEFFKHINQVKKIQTHSINFPNTWFNMPPDAFLKFQQEHS